MVMNDGDPTVGGSSDTDGDPTAGGGDDTDGDRSRRWQRQDGEDPKKSESTRNYEVAIRPHAW